MINQASSITITVFASDGLYVITVLEIPMREGNVRILSYRVWWLFTEKTAYGNITKYIARKKEQ